MSIEFDGLVVPFGRNSVLAYGPDAQALNLPLFGPPVHICPAYRIVGQSDYLLPDEAIDDRGQHFFGRQAVEWIETAGAAFPRADAIGQTSSGEHSDVRLKELDLAVLALFASAGPGTRPVRLDLAIEALAVPDGYALAPTAAPPAIETFARGLRFYRLAPGVFGAVGAALIQRLLATGRADWQLTFDDLDNFLDPPSLSR